MVARSDENLFFNAEGESHAIKWRSGAGTPITSLEDWKKLGYESRSLIADPLFVNVEKDDYRLMPESPALKLGFIPIDITKIGIRDKEQE